MRNNALITAACVVLALAGSATAQDEHGTAAQARAMLERAVRALKADESAALEKFRTRADGFGERDLYVFCNGPDGASIAHPDPAQASTNLNTLRDAEGKAFGKEMLAKAKEGEIATVDYKFPRLGDSKPVAKETSVTRVGRLVCGVGFYK